MANYYASARTNYFRVKDEPTFTEWAENRGVNIIRDAEQRFGLLPNDDNNGSFPNHDLDNEEEIDFMAELSEHLADGSVAIMMEAGTEKLRYINGYAEAINNKGDRVVLDLSNIYELAKTLGTEITFCEY